MKPIKTLADELSDLVEIAENEGHFCWEAFEKRDDGHLVFHSLYKCYPYDFYLRVGLHMKQPRQAIMCCGKFIKMRKFETKPHWHLKDLNPHNLKDSLYFVAGTGGYGQTIAGAWPNQMVTLGGIQTNYNPPSYHWNPEKAYPEPTTIGSPYYTGYQQFVPTTTTTTAGSITVAGTTTFTNPVTFAQPVTFLQGANQQAATAVNSGSWTGLGQPATGIQPTGLLGTIGSMLGLSTKI